MSFCLSVYEKGEIVLSEECSEFQQVLVGKIEEFEPKIPGILDAVNEMLRLEAIVEEMEFILI